MTLEDIKNYVFTVKAADGSEKEVLLSDIASIEETQTLSEINREEQKRVLTVTARSPTDIILGLSAGIWRNGCTIIRFRRDIRLQWKGKMRRLMTLWTSWY